MNKIKQIKLKHFKFFYGELNKIRDEPFSKRGQQVEFELSTADRSSTYKFELKLEDDFRLLKESGKDSVISKGMVNCLFRAN